MARATLWGGFSYPCEIAEMEYSQGRKYLREVPQKGLIMLRRKKSPPPLPIALYSFCFNFVKQHIPTWVGPTAHDTVNEGHCAAIIMESLIGIPADEMNDLLKSALATANEIYERTVDDIQKLPGEDRLQASITIARLICNIIYMKKNEKRNFFRRKSGES